MSSISVMPAALVFATLNVTGPAPTLALSSLQVSLPFSLAIVTLTVFTPPELEVAVALVAVSACDPQPLSANAVAAASAGAPNRKLRDTELVAVGGVLLAG